MKAFLSGLLLFTGGLALTAHADEPVKAEAEQPRWNTIAECQMVVLPQQAALALLPELNDDARIENAFARLQSMIEKGEAQLAGNLLAKGRDGEKSHAESIEEMRYPTSFDPPKLPDKLPAEKPLEFLKAWPLVAAKPMEFETRAVGTSVEFESRAAADGKWLDVSVVAAHVRFLRWTKFEIGVLPTGQHLTAEQPCFHTIRNATSLRLRNGQRVLLGFHKLPEPAETFELILLRVSATKAN